MYAAAVLLPGSAGCAKATSAPAAAGLHYECRGGDSFTVRDGDPAAVVRFGDGVSYVLHRRTSSIGRKFGSDEATLIIDGKSAVFVSEDRLDLDGCTAAEPNSGLTLRSPLPPGPSGAPGA